MLKQLRYATAVALCGATLTACGVSDTYFSHLHKGEPFVEAQPDTTQAPEGSDAAPAPQAPLPDGGLAPEEGAILPPRDAQDACPYLPDPQWVADTVGERTLAQGVDGRFDTPACVFWSYNEKPSLITLVRHFPDEELARQAVDFYAPIDATSPASRPVGWTGGRGSFPGMAVYAVQKGPVSVIAISNQEQTIKVQTAAEEVIKNLGL